MDSSDTALPLAVQKVEWAVNFKDYSGACQQEIDAVAHRIGEHHLLREMDLGTGRMTGMGGGWVC